MVDKGYDGVKNDYPTLLIYQPYKARRHHPLREEQRAYNRLVPSYRIVMEHSIAQMSRFQVLAQRFRNELAIHPLVVRVVAWIVNLRIAVKPLKVYAGGEK